MHRPSLFPLLLATSALAAVDPLQLHEARALYDQRRLPEAQVAFAKLAASNPGESEISYYLGLLATRRGDTDDAINLLQKATLATPSTARYYNALGDAAGQAAQKASIFSQPGLAKRCRIAYEKAVELDPANVSYRRSLLGFYRQAPDIVGGGMDKAYAQTEAIRKLDAAAGRFEPAGLYVADKKFAEEFAEALKIAPDDYGALYQTGRLAAVSGERPDRGLECLRRCLTLTPRVHQPTHAAAHWRIGNILEKKGDKPPPAPPTRRRWTWNRSSRRPARP